MAQSGISDKIKVLKESTFADGGADGEQVFGVTQRFEWNSDTHTQQSYGLETDGAQPTVNNDGILEISGTHEWELTDGRELKAILGDITDSNGAFSLDVTKALPSYTVKVVDEDSDSKYLAIRGLKYSKFTIDASREENVTITGEWFAKDIVDTGSFTPSTASVEPLTFLDATFAKGGTYQSGVDNFSLEIDRSIVPRRFLEQTGTGDRRKITELIPGVLSLAINGAMTTQRTVINEILGATGTYADTRSDISLTAKYERGDSTLQLDITGGRFTTTGRAMEKESEVSLIEFSGIGIDISGSGSYPT